MLSRFHRIPKRDGRTLATDAPEEGGSISLADSARLLFASPSSGPAARRVLFFATIPPLSGVLPFAFFAGEFGQLAI